MSSRLPVGHPDFQYPVSKNPYWAKVREFAGRIYTDNDSEKYIGHWRDHFVASDRSYKNKKLHVEIGCNAGHVTVEWAAQNSEDLFIGIDWKFKMIHKAVEKCIKKKLDHVMFFRAHAERIHFMFKTGEVDCLYLFFPDPWSKKSQLKNRFFTEKNLINCAAVVKKGGTFEIRTDHPGYFEWMETEVAKVSKYWRVISRTNNRHEKHPDPKSLKIPEITLFEKIFIAEGIPIHQMVLSRL